ncbi:MAG: acyltransferase [Acidobacteria bacterium]|nr:acyltransferase [Acidobacteriota bacterium]
MADRRDPFLDYLRGIAIIWVVMAHVLYFKSFFPYPLLQSYMLFEMPTIFFVSGASLFFSISRREPVGRFLAKRISRLLKPYYLLAAVCIPLHYALAISRGEPVSFQYLVRWLVLRPTDTTPRYIEFYLWFVMVALTVSLLHPLLGWLYRNLRTRIFTMILLAAGIVIESLGFLKPLFDVIWSILPEYWARIASDTIWYAIFYSFFVFLGYCYADGRLAFKPGVFAASALVTGGLILVAILRGPFHLDMNLNKFPPNLVYALFGLTWIALFLFLRPAINRFFTHAHRLGEFITYCGRHSYSIYLWHGFGFWILDAVLRWTNTETGVVSLFYPVPLLLYFGVVLIFSYYFSRVVDDLVPA